MPNNFPTTCEVRVGQSCVDDSPANISLDPTAEYQLGTVGEMTYTVDEYCGGAAGQLCVRHLTSTTSILYKEQEK